MNPSFVVNPSLSDTFSRYLRAQAALPDKPREPLPLAITISREAGAGGMAIAELLARHLTAAEKSPATSPWAVFNANLAKTGAGRSQTAASAGTVYDRGCPAADRGHRR